MNANNVVAGAKQIAELKAMEEKLKREEASGVAARIKQAIAAYGFTPDDLFGANPASAAPRQATKPVSKSKSKIGQKAQYADGAGNEWVGRGPRQTWLRDALESGKSLADFAVSRAAKKNAKATVSVIVPDAQQEQQSPIVSALVTPKKRAIKYRDGEGNTWSGGGSQPRWLTAALSSGKALEDPRLARVLFAACVVRIVAAATDS